MHLPNIDEPSAADLALMALELHYFNTKKPEGACVRILDLPLTGSTKSMSIVTIHLSLPREMEMRRQRYSIMHPGMASQKQLPAKEVLNFSVRHRAGEEPINHQGIIVNTYHQGVWIEVLRGAYRAHLQGLENILP